MAPTRKRARFPNRLREVRKMRGRSLAWLAEHTGKPLSSVQRYETGQYELTINDAAALARALECDTAALLPGAESRVVPLVGKVGAGTQVFPLDDHAKGAGLDEVEAPANLDPRKTVAVEIDGDSMFPLESGWVLFYSREPDRRPEDLIGKLCIVKLADTGAMMVKQLRRGFERERFTLVSSNAPPIENVRLEWAAPVLGMQPPVRAPLISRRV